MTSTTPRSFAALRMTTGAGAPLDEDPTTTDGEL